MRIQRACPALVAAFSYCLFASSLYAAAARANVTASRLYVPVGYDDNDDVFVVLEGYLDTPCEQIRGAKVHRKGNAFLIEPKRDNHGVKCEALKVPYTLEVRLNPDDYIPEGHYEVHVAGHHGRMLVEPLDIVHATDGRPDDYNYAPVDDAEVGLLSGGRMRAQIVGRFQNTCTTVEKIKFGTKNGKTYEMRPITKALTEDPMGGRCVNKEVRFTAKVDFDEPSPGRYLLHVRGQGGSAVNKIFTNIW